MSQQQSTEQGFRMAPSHPAYPVLTSAELIEHTRAISPAIELCGASPELTNAVTLASDLVHHVVRYVEAQKPAATETVGYTPSPIMQYFAYAHLPEHLQVVSKPIGELAEKMDRELPNGAEKATGLRKLLEAKDALVRANLPVR